MKKAKRNAILGLIVFALLVAGAVYAVLQGLGADAIGRAKDIPLGLDLQGGVSVTYEIQEDDATDEQINATIDKLQRRVDTYSPDAEVYKQGSKRITVEIPVDTSKYDPNAILDALGRPGKLEFIDPTNYEKFAAGEEYEAALTGSDVKNAEGGRRLDSKVVRCLSSVVFLSSDSRTSTTRSISQLICQHSRSLLRARATQRSVSISS